MKLMKFDLPINGKRIRNLEELTDNMTVEILGHYKSGLLSTWLKACNYEDELKMLDQLTDLDDPDLLKALCEMFDVEITDDVVSAVLTPATEFAEKYSAEDSGESEDCSTDQWPFGKRMGMTGILGA